MLSGGHCYVSCILGQITQVNTDLCVCRRKCCCRHEISTFCTSYSSCQLGESRNNKRMSLKLKTFFLFFNKEGGVIHRVKEIFAGIFYLQNSVVLHLLLPVIGIKILTPGCSIVIFRVFVRCFCMGSL